MHNPTPSALLFADAGQVVFAQIFGVRPISDLSILFPPDAGDIMASQVFDRRGYVDQTRVAPVITMASRAGTAGLNIPHGTAPSSPVNGDVWSTAAGIFWYVNGTTFGPIGSYGY